MPNVKRLSISGPHFSSDHIRLITIVGPGFLVTKNFIVLRIALRIDFLVLNRLFTNVGENGPIKIELILTRPQTVEALLVGVVITSNHNTNDKTMLRERLGKVRMGIRSERLTNNGTLGSTGRFRAGLLDDLIDIDGYTVTAEIFGTLKPSIGRRHTEERADNLSITRTATGLLLIEFLNLERKTKLVNGGTNTARSNGPKVIDNRYRPSTTRRSIKNTSSLSTSKTISRNIKTNTSPSLRGIIISIIDFS